MATLMDEFDAYYARLKDSVDIVLARDVARAVVDRIENMAEVNVYAAYRSTTLRQATLCTRPRHLKDTMQERSATSSQAEKDITGRGHRSTTIRSPDPGWNRD